jgi:uncharacterized protein with HEPN domain
MGDKSDVKHFLDDIIESIEKINSYSKDITEEEFLSNIEKQDAITRRVEIIGGLSKIFRMKSAFIFRKFSGRKLQVFGMFQFIIILV